MNRIKIREYFLRLAIDFSSDSLNSILPFNSGSVSDSVLIGGLSDQYLPLNDFEGKRVDQLNFGCDDPDAQPANLEYLLDQYLHPKEPSIYGLPDGVEPIEDLDPDHVPYSRDVITDNDFHLSRQPI